MIVADGTGSMSLVLWDREVVQVIGRTTNEVKESFVRMVAN